MKTNLTKLWTNHIQAKNAWDRLPTNENTIKMLSTYGIYKCYGGRRELNIRNHAFTTDKAAKMAKQKYEYYIDGIIDLTKVLEIFINSECKESEKHTSIEYLHNKYGCSKDIMFKNRDHIQLEYVMHKIADRITERTKDREAFNIVEMTKIIWMNTCKVER